MVVGTADSSPATPTTAGSPTTQPPRPLSTVPVPAVEMAVRWVGVRADGVTVILQGVDGGQMAEVEVPVAVGEGGTSVVGVLMQDGAVVVDECCEPAAGRWFRWLVDTGGLVEGSWFGQVTDVDAAGRMLAADPNGFVVKAATPEGDLFAEWRAEADGAPAVAPTDAAWSPDGSLIAFVGNDPSGDVLLAVFGSEAAGLGEATVVDRGSSDGVHPAFPVIDRDGRIWYVLVDEASQVPTVGRGLVPKTRGGRVADGRTGDVVGEVVYDGSVVDQSIDPSGTYLIITYADGWVVWRTTDGTASGTLADSGYLSADW